MIIGEFQWTQSSLFPDFDWRIVKWAKLSWAEPPAGRRKHSSTCLLSSALQSTMCSQHKLQSIMWLCSQQIAVYSVLQSTHDVRCVYNVQSTHTNYSRQCDCAVNANCSLLCTSVNTVCIQSTMCSQHIKITVDDVVVHSTHCSLLCTSVNTVYDVQCAMFSIAKVRWSGLAPWGEGSKTAGGSEPGHCISALCYFTLFCIRGSHQNG